MLLFAVLAAATIAVGAVCALFWNNILTWIKKVGEKLKAKIQKAVYGVKLFASKIQGKLKQLSKNYVRNGTEWEEIVVTKEIQEEEVPDYILALEEGNELDITNELEMTLAA